MEWEIDGHHRNKQHRWYALQYVRWAEHTRGIWERGPDAMMGNNWVWRQRFLGGYQGVESNPQSPPDHWIIPHKGWCPILSGSPARGIVGGWCEGVMLQYRWDTRRANTWVVFAMPPSSIFGPCKWAPQAYSTERWNYPIGESERELQCAQHDSRSPSVLRQLPQKDESQGLTGTGG